MRYWFYVFNLVLRVLQLYKAILLKIRGRRDATIIFPCLAPFTPFSRLAFLNLMVFIRVVYRNMAEGSFREV